MKEKFEQLKSKLNIELKEAQNAQTLEDLRIKYLGKKGQIKLHDAIAGNIFPYAKYVVQIINKGIVGNHILIF